MSGELFLWNRDKDLLKTATAVPEVVQIINSAQGWCCRRPSILGIEVKLNQKRVLMSKIKLVVTRMCHSCNNDLHYIVRYIVPGKLIHTPRAFPNVFT